VKISLMVRQYADAINCTNSVTLGNGITISVVTPVYFLATKFEAFHNRSAGNYYSVDIEDIVFLLEHRSGILIEVMDGLGDDPGSVGVIIRQLELMAKLDV